MIDNPNLKLILRTLMRTHHNPILIFYLCSNTAITCDTYNWLDLKLENYRQNYTIVESDAMYNKRKKL